MQVFLVQNNGIFVFFFFLLLCLGPMQVAELMKYFACVMMNVYWDQYNKAMSSEMAQQIVPKLENCQDADWEHRAEVVDVAEGISTAFLGGQPGSGEGLVDDLCATLASCVPHCCHSRCMTWFLIFPSLLGGGILRA